MSIHPDRQQPERVPATPGPALVRLLVDLNADPFAQAALLRLYATAPAYLDTSIRLRITAAIRTDRNTQHPTP